MCDVNYDNLTSEAQKLQPRCEIDWGMISEFDYIAIILDNAHSLR